MKDQLEALIGQLADRGILLGEAVAEFERRFIKHVMDSEEGNQSRAARTLGIHRNTLGRKLEEYKLDRNGRRHF